ncbi:FGGY-family carbohydrate kinase [Tessaracoccus coleopterorum]|uniref:FGGY-family carbohydrate kinase n=1 Tax=Tessaracoccus coleopterorum TaxID=2714950 RepID=UPI0018D43837
MLSEASRAANLTNEIGVDGTVRYLKNVMGMWLLSECLRDWERAGRSHTVPELIAAAADVGDVPRFDATDPSLMQPGGMPARIRALAGDDPRLDDPAFLTRTILESLADAYTATLAELSALTGRRPRRLAIVGGGSNNWLLNQLTADRSGLEVTAGPAEATALGNALIQARAVGLADGDLTDLRRIVMDSSNVTTHVPTPLAAITALSNEFGADPAFVRAGGGNSSAKVDGVLWIKPSGVSMAAIGSGDLVPLRLDVLLDSLDAPDPDPSFGDPVNHIATLARTTPGRGARPWRSCSTRSSRHLRAAHPPGADQRGDVQRRRGAHHPRPVRRRRAVGRLRRSRPAARAADQEAP